MENIQQIINDHIVNQNSFIDQNGKNRLKECAEAVDQDWKIRIELCLRTLADNLVDRDTNFGMNESYRLALDEVAEKLGLNNFEIPYEKTN